MNRPGKTLQDTHQGQSHRLHRQDCLSLPALRRAAVASSLALVLVLVAAVPAAAHAELVSSNPQDGQVVTAPPSQVALHFSENVAPQLSHFFLTAPGGNRAEAQAQVNGQDVVLNVGSLVPQGAATAGKYVVDGQVTAADGHQSTMSLSFTVETAAATGTGTPPKSGSTGQSSGPSGGTGGTAAPTRTPQKTGGRLWTYVLISLVGVVAALSVRRRRP